MLIKRPPVITIMGHVDHGKTSLLDYIRNSRVASRETGGITQHIGAYQVSIKGEKLTFIDTPGHAAFNKMRERGSKITDLVVLVVAANDGIKPQTIEAIRHIKTAGVPCIVAINKMDLASADPMKVKAQLAEHELLVTEFAGDIECIEISAKTGKGIDELLETLVLTAEILDLKADPEGELRAVVVESFMDKMTGAVADVIVQNGTLEARQDVFTIDASGRVRAIFDDLGKPMKIARPGDPARLIGFTQVPGVGEIIQGNNDFGELKAEVEAAKVEIAFGDLDFSVFAKNKDLIVSKIPIIMRADTQGTLEAIVNNFDTDSIQLVASGVGMVSDNDLDLAKASGAKIIAFQVKVDNRILTSAKNMGVKIKQYQIIYELIEDLQKQMLKLMDPGIDERIIGEAEVLQIFEMKGMKIAGIKVRTGEIKKADLFHLKRGEEMLINPVINSMMKDKVETQSIKAGNEGAVTFKNKRLDFAVGDMLIAYIHEDF